MIDKVCPVTAESKKAEIGRNRIGDKECSLVDSLNKNAWFGYVPYGEFFSGSTTKLAPASTSPEVKKPLEWKDYLGLFFVLDDEAETLWPSVCRFNYIRRVIERRPVSATEDQSLETIDFQDELNIHTR